MDPITHPMLTTLRIEELLRGCRPPHEPRAPRHGGPGRPATIRPTRPYLEARLHTLVHAQLAVRPRRRLGALLIRAGRRLAQGARPRDYPLYGSAHR